MPGPWSPCCGHDAPGTRHPAPGGPLAPRTPLTPLTVWLPAQSVITEVLRIQKQSPDRTRFERLFGKDPVHPDGSAWYKGALGEIAVGQVLSELGAAWTVLHAVPVGEGTSDIDHVLVGPAGVFTVNTKHHAGQPIWVAGRTFMVAGHRQRHIPNAIYEARRTAKLLSAVVREPVPVVGVIVVVNPKSLNIKRRPTEVNVLTSSRLLRWLRQRTPIFSPERAARITAAAVLPGTWSRTPAAAVDTSALVHDFMVLRAAVAQARRRRITWLLGVPAAVVIGPALLRVVGLG